MFQIDQTADYQSFQLRELPSALAARDHLSPCRDAKFDPTGRRIGFLVQGFLMKCAVLLRRCLKPQLW